MGKACLWAKTAQGHYAFSPGPVQDPPVENSTGGVKEIKRGCRGVCMKTSHSHEKHRTYEMPSFTSYLHKCQV